ncbi:biopolymer transporter ExbD [Nitratifractor sp.]|uniref:ExbD/TolR family protein n=1 Tax=Nitratifractor sp. TaxID=2268144 RepID=UPI0025F3F0A0|nr:biopolymer transporter ExbD [Nitratifractor sp.]
MRRRRFTEINVVPFIDIVLVLLVIVLATATFVVKNELPVDLPKSGSQSKVPPKSVSITIDQNGSYFFRKQKVGLQKLRLELTKLDPKKDLITLNADQKSQFQKFVTVVDLLKKKGFKKISILTAQ